MTNPSNRHVRPSAKRFSIQDLEQQTIDYLMGLIFTQELPPKDAVALLSVITKSKAEALPVEPPPAETQGPQVTIAYHPPIKPSEPIEIVPYYPG